MLKLHEYGYIVASKVRKNIDKWIDKLLKKKKKREKQMVRKN